MHGRPALVAMKQRQMQLEAGANSRRGGNAPRSGSRLQRQGARQQERSWVEQAEKAYARFVCGFR